MIAVTFKPLLHCQQECIGIYFAKNAAINNIVRLTIHPTKTSIVCLDRSQPNREAAKQTYEMGGFTFKPQ